MPTRINTWLRKGFLPEEALEFSRISAAGMKAPYIQKMISKRLSLNAARVRYGWTRREYRHRIALEYKEKGVNPKAMYPGLITRKTQANLIWDYFNFWKEAIPIPDDWVSPKKKKRTTIPKHRKPQTTKRALLKDRISRLNDQISRAAMNNQQALRRTLELERNRYQNELDWLS